jgi:hypothetical protein
MLPLSDLLQLVVAAPSAKAPEGRARRGVLAFVGLLGGVVCAGIWGACATANLAGATSNLVKVPMLLVVSALATLPAVLFFTQLFGGGRTRASDLFLAYSAAFFGGTLTLAVLSPIVALYEHSSRFFGPYASMASVVAGLAVAVVLLVRTLRRVASSATPWTTFLPSVIALVVLQGAALAQLSSSVSPVFDHRTRFGHGVDGLQSSSPPEDVGP